MTDSQVEGLQGEQRTPESGIAIKTDSKHDDEGQCMSQDRYRELEGEIADLRRKHERLVSDLRSLVLAIREHELHESKAKGEYREGEWHQGVLQSTITEIIERNN